MARKNKNVGKKNFFILASLSSTLLIMMFVMFSGILTTPTSTTSEAANCMQKPHFSYLSKKNVYNDDSVIYYFRVKNTNKSWCKNTRTKQFNPVQYSIWTAEPNNNWKVEYKRKKPRIKWGGWQNKSALFGNLNPGVSHDIRVRVTPKPWVKSKKHLLYIRACNQDSVDRQLIPGNKCTRYTLTYVKD